ncbi:MAG TPA: ATP cone domain-containing protein [archaeon]|nr:ATP cone domain-containing protein [archaeon]
MAKPIYVIKASGHTERFNPQKIKNTCLRSGADEELSDKIVREVRAKVYNGITTQEILQMTLRLLGKVHPVVAAKYDLKGAMLRLGPAGFAFESFFAEVLKEYGYKTKTHQMIQGSCVIHEIDAVASMLPKSGYGRARVYMIENKYHNVQGIHTGLKETLYTYARFLDLRDGFKMGKCQKFDQPWLACNTKFSSDAEQYARCKNIRLTGWNYPVGEGLQNMIEGKRLYPITILRTLDEASKQKLSEAKIMLCKDIITIDLKKLRNMTDISYSKLLDLKAEAEKILD